MIDLPKPLAVFAPSDGLARILIEQLIDLNIHIPRDVAVLGVDDDPYQNSLSPIPLSSVQLPGHRIGEMAAEKLFNWIEKKKTPQPVRKMKPVRVVTRLSTDNAYCDDEFVADALDIINEQLPDLKSTDDLVQRLKVSRRTLEWRFRKELGHTVNDELTHARIESARVLLSTTNLTGEQIAHRVPAIRPFLASSNYSHVIFLAPHSMSIGNYTQPSSSVSREGFFKSLNRRNTSRIPPSVNQTVKITVAPNRMPRWIPHHSFHAVEETS